MKKKFISVLALMLFAICLFSCGKEEAPIKDIDIDKLAEDIFDQEPFTEELVMLDFDDVAQYGQIFGFKSDVEKVYAYVGGGATPEELVIIKAQNDSFAEEVLFSLQQYRKDKIALYESYRQSEVPKLEKAVIEKSGSYVVYCVSEKDVSETINAYFN